jgi:hypothetical protein
MKSKSPNFYRCRRPEHKGGCGHSWDVTDPAAPSVAVCPQCGYQARLRCGANYKKHSERSQQIAAAKGKVLRTWPCKRMVARVGDRCDRHLRRGRIGAANNRFTTGRTSRHMPAAMAELFESVLNDPNLKTLDETFGLLQVRRLELLRQLNAEHRRCWSDATAAADVLEPLVFSGGDERSIDAMRALRVALLEGSQAEEKNESTWGKISEVERQRTATVNVEARRMQAQQGVISEQQHAAFMHALLRILSERLEPGQLNDVQNDLIKLGRVVAVN